MSIDVDALVGDCLGFLATIGTRDVGRVALALLSWYETKRRGQHEHDGAIASAGARAVEIWMSNTVRKASA